MSHTLLILRPEPGASATARRARAAGFDVVVAPLFVVRPLAWISPGPAGFDALVLTSANAVRHAGPALAGLAALPVYAVGAATAVAARAAGFATVHAGAADAAALAGQAQADSRVRLLHLAGREHRALAGPGLMVDTRPVYAADGLTALPVHAVAALRGGAVALLHSPRAATAFRMLAATAGLDRATLRIAAISPAALGAAGQGWRDAIAADRPADDALLAAAARLCDQGGGRDG